MYLLDILFLQMYKNIRYLSINFYIFKQVKQRLITVALEVSSGFEPL